ncbi:MAG: phosphohistidine phosphatase SixA [Chthoniobacterales bacterium]|nr:MAG: phosphohistidine phosphatase SixA [Chthoniobacterales bacterium]
MKKLVYLIRHGEADWPDWTKPDDERPLTKKGKAEVKRVAKFLRRAGAEPLLIFASPLARAKQTAKIIANELCLELGIEESLGKGFDAAKFKRVVDEHDVKEMMLVGHEPDFTSLIHALTGGNVALSKCGLALIELEDSGAKGTLRWLFPPRLAKRS